MAGSEPVTSPDQHKPGSRKAARIGAIFTIAVLTLMQFGNNSPGGVDRIWLISIAAVLAVVLIGDVVLRRNGLRQ